LQKDKKKEKIRKWRKGRSKKRSVETMPWLLKYPSTAEAFKFKNVIIL
jgi:hypothetical protein